MANQRPLGETDHCRGRLLRYCAGQGLDLGCGAVKIKPEAIGVDLHHAGGDMRRDARKVVSGVSKWNLRSNLCDCSL